MTREDIENSLDAMTITKYGGKHLGYYAVIELFREVLNDFESRTCESCDWFSEDENGYVCNQEHQMYTYDDRRAYGYLSPDKNFYCSKWEKKQ